MVVGLLSVPKLCKYQTKGHDRAMVATAVEGQEGAIDEISDYEDLRSVGSSEASWHLLGFPIAERYPPVQALRVHLEDQQQIVFDEGTEDEPLDNQRDAELNWKRGEEVSRTYGWR